MWNADLGLAYSGSPDADAGGPLPKPLGFSGVPPAGGFGQAGSASVDYDYYGYDDSSRYQMAGFPMGPHGGSYNVNASAANNHSLTFLSAADKEAASVFYNSEQPLLGQIILAFLTLALLVAFCVHLVALVDELRYPHCSLKLIRISSAFSQMCVTLVLLGCYAWKLATNGTVLTLLCCLWNLAIALTMLTISTRPILIFLSVLCKALKTSFCATKTVTSFTIFLWMSAMLVGIAIVIIDLSDANSYCTTEYLNGLGEALMVPGITVLVLELAVIVPAYSLVQLRHRRGGNRQLNLMHHYSSANGGDDDDDDHHLPFPTGTSRWSQHHRDDDAFASKASSSSSSPWCCALSHAAHAAHAHEQRCPSCKVPISSIEMPCHHSSVTPAPPPAEPGSAATATATATPTATATETETEPGKKQRTTLQQVVRSLRCLGLAILGQPANAGLAPDDDAGGGGGLFTVKIPSEVQLHSTSAESDLHEVRAPSSRIRISSGSSSTSSSSGRSSPSFGWNPLQSPSSSFDSLVVVQEASSARCRTAASYRKQQQQLLRKEEREEQEKLQVARQAEILEVILSSRTELRDDDPNPTLQERPRPRRSTTPRYKRSHSEGRCSVEGSCLRSRPTSVPGRIRLKKLTQVAPYSRNVKVAKVIPYGSTVTRGSRPPRPAAAAAAEPASRPPPRSWPTWPFLEHPDSIARVASSRGAAAAACSSSSDPAAFPLSDSDMEQAMLAEEQLLHTVFSPKLGRGSGQFVVYPEPSMAQLFAQLLEYLILYLPLLGGMIAGLCAPKDSFPDAGYYVISYALLTSPLSPGLQIIFKAAQAAGDCQNGFFKEDIITDEDLDFQRSASQKSIIVLD